MTQGNRAAIRKHSFSENGKTLTTGGSNYGGNAIAKFGKRQPSHHISASVTFTAPASLSVRQLAQHKIPLQCLQCQVLSAAPVGATSHQ